MKFSNKLSLVILLVGFFILILSTIGIYIFSYDSIIESQLINTKAVVKEVSEDFDHILEEKVKTAMTLSNAPTIRGQLAKSNKFYANLSVNKRKEHINRKNIKWKATKSIDKFILNFTNNSVSHYLKSQQVSIKDEYGEIFLTNKFGALVASTSKLSTFAHGHKYWWKGSYNNGKGAIFIDDRGYDDSVGGYVLGLVIPVRNGKEVIGILKCNLNILGSINSTIDGSGHGHIGAFKLIRSGGMIVYEQDSEPLSTRVPSEVLKKILSKNEAFIINDSMEEYLVGASEIEFSKGKKGYRFGGSFKSVDHKKGNTGESWYVLCYVKMSIAKLPIIKLIKIVVLSSITIILLLSVASFLFGRRIAKPLLTLQKGINKIGKGDFKYKINIKQRDEFGNLANSFNEMADNLYTSTTSIKLLKNEIAERKKAEKEKTDMQKQIFQTSKLASIGELAAGVGHEINNPLAIIFGYMEKISNKYRKEIPDLIEPIDIVLNSTERIKKIVDGLRTFARMDTEHIQTVNVHKTINDSISLIETIYKQENIIIENLYKADKSEIKGNIGKLQQVIMNLFSNAKDALSQRGGTIKIETRNKRNKVILKFSDDGVGIKKEDLDRIFDTFFTTKEVGKGTGLGLGISHSIIEGMNGKIEVDSEYGIGTEFTITLPIAGKAKLLEEEEEEEEEVMKLKGKILVVDDEDVFRALVCDNLKDLGLEVDDADEGDTALEKIKKNKYDYIITDLKMPRMGGDVLIQEARKLGGKEKIIVITGGIVTDYTSEQRYALRKLSDGYLKKPFKNEEIYAALKNAGNEKSSS